MRVPPAIVGALLLAVSASAQPAPEPPTRLTLEQAMQYALEHYPTVKAALQRVSAAQSGVDVARATYLPRLDSLWQTNRATVNNIFGQVLPQSVIPAMSGPVLPETSSQSVWGTAAGALFTWEPWDFGLRKAEVTGAEASVGKARASEALTRLDVQNAAGAAFLAVIAADRAVIAAQADFDRRDVLARRVRVLVDNELRPGAEASRALAERAAANTRLIQAGAARLLARASLTRLLGLTQGSITIEASGVLDAAPPPAPGAPAPAAHPLLQVHQTAIDAARAEVDVLARTDRPRLFVQSSVFARGSGANPSGPFAGGTDGLGFERANWAAGVQIQFPNVFDFASLGARRASAAASERAESALYDEALLSVSSQRQVAEMLVQAARAVAENTPVQRSAASQSEAQAKARYEAGLASIAEVADAQNLLAQAEYQDQLARVDVWRALLAQAAAGGTLTPFLELLRPPSGVR